MSRRSTFRPSEDDLILDPSSVPSEIASQLGCAVQRIYRRRRYLLREQGQGEVGGDPVARHSAATIETVRRMRADGASYRDIAAAIGTTRSCAAGLVARHCKDIKVVRRVGSPVEVVKVEVVRVERPKPAPKPVAPPVLTIVTDPKPFVRASGCRWPLWRPDAALRDKDVCGVECGLDTYCAGHAALAYRVPEKRRAA